MTTARSSIRTLTLSVTALLVGALLAAPAGQAAPPTAASGVVAIGAGGLHGGDAVPGSTARCTIAFNARDAAGAYYFLTSGLCGGGVGTVFYDSSRNRVGVTVATGSDWAIVKYDPGITPPGNVDLYNGAYQDIVTAAAAYVGEPARRSGAVTGVHSGSVTGVNVTLNTAEGTRTGLIKTNICAESGDAGGPLFDGTKALGILVASSGNCSTGGTSFYRPVTVPLAAYGLTVY